jgi:hypothetical protein
MTRKNADRVGKPGDLVKHNVDVLTAAPLLWRQDKIP